jgi:hypothetical protein
MSDYDFKTTGFEVKGFKALYKLIDHLPEVVKKVELEPLLVEALGPMAEYARVMAPDDPLTLAPYNLPTSIIVSTRQRTGRSKSDRALGKYDARAYMGPNRYGYPQAMMQEFGTIHHVAQPYMRPAYDSEKGTALRIIREGFAERLQLIVRRYGVKS